ncbi:MAG: hypothetical protein IIX69_00145 [Clostridia bacterium]|nr:hypothetical protein [Clostridia bacterium]MBQ1934373.1 hypothetical protein [Clostridia bacterium]MBR0327459.1 hypothetical protein [Clostridia bacterium]
MKKRIAALALAIAASVLCVPQILAEEDYLPTVYIADDVWYKDKSQPLINDGKNGFFAPIDAFGALPGVSVTIDNTVNAARLESGEKVFSVDTLNGTIILPDGDTSVNIKNEYDTVYLKVDDTCRLLGISYETRFYSNGKRAIRINDGSGALEFSVLIRMFATQTDTLTRTTGEIAEAFPSRIVAVSSYPELGEALNLIMEVDCSFLLALNAELVLSLPANELTAVLGEIHAAGVPISLFTYADNPDLVLHYVHSANLRMLELMHRGTYLYTSTLKLSEIDRALISEMGYMITDLTLEVSEEE